LHAGTLVVWLRIAAPLLVAGAIVVSWRWGAGIPLTPSELAGAVAPHREAWYALPLVVAAFVVLGLVLFPVLALIAATGLAFGPVLGPIYAMAGALASASAGFAIGRHLGRRRVERFAGGWTAPIAGTLRRNGTLAVFLVRKVPAPFTLVNIVVGASSISYRDFVLGTLLGMAAIVVALAGFGSQLGDLFDDPSPGTLARAALIVGVPLAVAFVVNRMVRPERTAA
jgi:uncharacterized membrane protein YdjX (TVP38/TMEM64 family)